MTQALSDRLLVVTGRARRWDGALDAYDDQRRRDRNRWPDRGGTFHLGDLHAWRLRPKGGDGTFSPSLWTASASSSPPLGRQETIWGENVPGGKLPVTMYYSNYTDGLSIDDMSMQAGSGKHTSNLIMLLIWVADRLLL